jgi:hypothetical protein
MEQKIAAVFAQTAAEPDPALSLQDDAAVIGLAPTTMSRISRRTQAPLGGFFRTSVLATAAGPTVSDILNPSLHSGQKPRSVAMFTCSGGMVFLHWGQ